MGSSYSDLYLYFKVKKSDDNKATENEVPNNNNSKPYTVKVKKENYDKCVNFEKVTHEITFTPTSKGTNYNILLYDGNESNKGNNVFGYYYPSNDKEVLKELHVYYSVLTPNDPLVVSFYTHGDQTYNFTYSGLKSTEWVRAYSISYYSLGQNVSSELLTNEFRKSHRNRKIQFVTGTNVVDVSGFKQDLEKDNVYRYIYYPDGNTSVLGSECLNNIKIDTSLPECPEPAKPASAPVTQEQPKSPEYDNKIDPYYLDFVNGHYYDGVILYFVKNGNKGKPNNNSQSSSDGQAAGNGKANSEKYDHNMAVLLELIDNCKPKTHIKRKDKHGNYWSQEKIEYNDDETLKKALKEIKETACKEDSTTFILENKKGYKGVSKVDSEIGKTTYSKYTHKANTPIKTNLLFRKSETKINDFETSEFKTKTLDVYFLKIGDNEQGYPFILMFTYENVNKPIPGAAAGGGNGQHHQQQQQQQQQPQQAEAGGSGAAGAASTQKECKKCYYSNENYEFKDWQELTVDKPKEAEPSETEKKEKTPKQTDDQGELEKKLEAKLAKIEDYGKCTKDINILRSIAYQVLTGVDTPDTTKAAPPEPEKRPLINVFHEKGTGTSLPVVLGSVAGGLVVLGTISAIIYGIYWYNTTIKLLT